MKKESIEELEKRLAKLKREKQAEKLSVDLMAAQKECDRLVCGEWWRRDYSSMTEYMAIKTVCLYRMIKLSPSHDAEQGMMVEGEYESICLPILPALIVDRVPSSRSRGIYLSTSGPVPALRVKAWPKRATKGTVPSYLHWNKGDERMLVPFAIGADRTTLWRQRFSTFAEGLVASTENEFKKGLRLTIEFVQSVQNAFQTTEGGKVCEVQATGS